MRLIDSCAYVELEPEATEAAAAVVARFSLTFPLHHESHTALLAAVTCEIRPRTHAQHSAALLPDFCQLRFHPKRSSVAKLWMRSPTWIFGIRGASGHPHGVGAGRQLHPAQAPTPPTTLNKPSQDRRESAFDVECVCKETCR